ncbi:MAG TPA: hypothetical protein ENN01_00325 [Halothiobacillus sp.]|nr:hypothetical protein [Halothiobacillus sp.]
MRREFVFLRQRHKFRLTTMEVLLEFSREYCQNSSPAQDLEVIQHTVTPDTLQQTVGLNLNQPCFFVGKILKVHDTPANNWGFAL